MQAEISVVATRGFRDAVENLGLQVALEGDVFGTGCSSGMALGGEACQEGNVLGIMVDLGAVWSDSEAVDVFGRIRCDGGYWVN